ncbi:MAG: AI-2E family transporter [Lachnospiraceae bacterium]
METEKGNREQENEEKHRRREREAENAYYSAKPILGKRGPSKISQHFNRGITAFLVVAASIAFYFALLRVTKLSDVFANIVAILQPIIYGCIIAYLLNPIVKRIDWYLIPVLKKEIKKQGRAEKISRGIGIFISIMLMITLIVLLCNLLVPELYFSIRSMIYTLPGQLNDLVVKINEMTTGKSTTSAFLRTALNEGSKMLETWLRNDLLPKTNELMSNLTVGVINVVSAIFDFLIGIIVSIYILFSKEKFVSQCKKSVYAIFSPEHANMLLHFTTKSNEIFGGFIIGKIIDSAIIGVLCFFGMSILKMPYTVLISVIIGVTNVIPFFGPYIGAIPSAILIMLQNPMQGIYFILFILVLQQFDGNILGPKILGNSTGLSAFWVIVAILLGGGLFGFIGMIMGVPTFAVIYYVVELFINSRLEKKKLPSDTQSYDPKSYVDDEGNYVNGK